MEVPQQHKEYIKINPVEEALKAIGIVHGAEQERLYRRILSVLERHQQILNAPPWTAARIQHLLDTEVRYKDWKFLVQERRIWKADLQSTDTEPDLRLRAEWTAPDMFTGKPELQKSRWWPLSQHMVKTEIIQTAFLCTLKAEEHEIREAFKYKGGAPFNTHIAIDTLMAISEQVEVRVDSRPLAPANQRSE
jgi:hypothetical protein